MREGYTVNRHDTLCRVSLGGDLTAPLVPDLQAAVKEQLAAGATDVEVDLGKTVMLDSSGIGLLIAIGNSLSRSGGHIRVVNVSRDIGRLLQTMRLTARLDVRQAG